MCIDKTKNSAPWKTKNPSQLGWDFQNSMRQV